ncbi:tyrosine-protein phosphatase [Cnuella takakiae]|uniref:tyrosine-protein phosphatase n=1 Tax=Cnuella takakiae TaxID=1302690 RepID=UPI0011607954|nr:CpsB/CapC family capsule biosynthesis tyrosine phosphatase [Cnuella takakiae]
MSWLNLDLHNHILPGIDDGSPNLETSLQLVRGMLELGVKHFIATPHILWEVYPNTPVSINDARKELAATLKSEGVDCTLRAAAEYFIDDHLVELLHQKDSLLCLPHKMVLAEFSMVTAPFELQQLFYDMQLQGYQPLLAHPERYIYLGRSRQVFDTLHDAGVYFQLNLMSLVGHYGRTVQELANYLLDKGYYQFAGTDLHSPRQLEVLQKLAASELIDKLRDYPFRNKDLPVQVGQLD